MSQRVVLLLDLDCFYAQCECVRLGFDSRETALALLQWNSVLAVTYPARTKYRVKRGDGWDVVREKSSGECYAVHVPLLLTAVAQSENDTSCNNSSGGHGAPPSVKDENSLNAATDSSKYEDEFSRIFQVTPEQQKAARESDLGKRKFSHEGKASIERYRIASARIFATVHEWIHQQHLANKIILERASIDEFYLDVTTAVNGTNDSDLWHDMETVLEKTKVVNESDQKQHPLVHCPGTTGMQGVEREDLDEIRRIQRGCWIGFQIRRFIWEQLHFTLSCGISVNKTLAKITAGYGKPDGQAVTYPANVPYLLEQTPISKCRNLGGKIGAAVQKLLPPNAEPTVAAIAHNLSLPALTKGLGGNEETARWVYQVARGIDLQLVQVKDTNSTTALTKSITSFKSLPFQVGGYGLEEAVSWIRLLAVDVVTRVEKDTHLNKRYPRSCTIQYHCPYPKPRREMTREEKRQFIYANKSLRVAYPPLRASGSSSRDEKIDYFVQCVLDRVPQKEGRSDLKIDRIGLAAMDFVSVGGSAMDRFLVKSGETPVKKGVREDKANLAEASSLDVGQSTRKESDSKGRGLLPFVSKTTTKTIRTDPNAANPNRRMEVIDADLALAKRLQANFDSERRLFEAAERTRIRGGKKVKTIDSFFRK